MKVVGDLSSLYIVMHYDGARMFAVGSIPRTQHTQELCYVQCEGMFCRRLFEYDASLPQDRSVRDNRHA